MTNSEVLGNKLYELRKNAGLSQEALADRLGVSRQAVSKWECGESLPDTDNLITISKLFEVSLDELVGNGAKQSVAVKEPSLSDMASSDEKTEKRDTYTDSEESAYAKKKRIIIKVFSSLPYSILVTIAFLLWGFLADGWAVAWTLFVTVPVYDSLIECIRKRKCGEFAYPVFVAFVYLLLGTQWSLWHPYWVIFITIPIYYAVASGIDKE